MTHTFVCQNAECIVMLSTIMQVVPIYTLNVVMLSVVKLNVAMLSVVILNVVSLSVVAPP